MKKIHLILFTLLLFAAACFSGCKSGIFDPRLSEGVIEYKITYPYMDPDNMMAGFLPDQMNMRFKDNVYINELSAGMGMFRTCFVSNSNDFVFTHLVKLINKKYVTRLEKQKAETVKSLYPTFTMVPMKETKVIAGYDCKKALIVFDDISKPGFYIYYTDEIRLENPNWYSPFYEIEGVLMEYQIEKYNIVMHFTATNVLEDEVDDNEFKVPEEYESISFEKMEKEMHEVFRSFDY